MTVENAVVSFLEASEDWLCDGCSLVVRYLAARNSGKIKIVDATLMVAPLAAPTELDFFVSAGVLLCGQKTYRSLRLKDLRKQIHEAAAGRISIGNDDLELEAEQTRHYYSEMAVRDRWFFDLHLQVWGGHVPPPTAEELLKEDYQLRSATPPFDGITDVMQWLQGICASKMKRK